MKQVVNDVLSARIALTRKALRPDSGDAIYNPVFPPHLRRPGEAERSENNSLPAYLVDIRETFFLVDDIENWHRFELVATGSRSADENENSFFAVWDYYRRMQVRDYYRSAQPHGKSLSNAKEALIALVTYFCPPDEERRRFYEDNFSRNEFRSLMRFARYCRHCGEVYSSFAHEMSWLALPQNYDSMRLPGSLEFRALLDDLSCQEFSDQFLVWG
ncbi:hypothetical protein GR217_22800 [Rhizobium leguminosarum]|uniref:Uncharacterized protein n=1 Tax=Rhizobium ruizarguesonis TaxID=2081791 RepID=A0AAE5C426_9HYPH|nr:hypothetical protein [Rhizobium ruizarguesonis]NEI50517.1 hypothetical protein [Rhizobium ruizarguesonis]